MKPIEFKEQTKTLSKPSSMTDEECGPLPVWSDGKSTISCWGMSLPERLRALLYGKIWVSVYMGPTQPPIGLVCEKSAFVQDK